MYQIRITFSGLTSTVAIKGKEHSLRLLADALTRASLYLPVDDKSRRRLAVLISALDFAAGELEKANLERLEEPWRSAPTASIHVTADGTVGIGGNDADEDEV